MSKDDVIHKTGSTYTKGDTEALKEVQKRTTKILPTLKDLPCTESLSDTILALQAYKRETDRSTKIVTGKYYHPSVAPTVDKGSIYACN